MNLRLDVVVGSRGGTNLRPGFTPGVVVGKIGGKVSDKRIEGLGPEELESVLPPISSNKAGVGDDLEGSGLQRTVQLAQPLFPAVGQEPMELLGCTSFLRTLVYIVVESLGVLDGRRERVVLVVQFGEQVVLLQAELPERPSQVGIQVHQGRAVIGTVRW